MRSPYQVAGSNERPPGPMRERIAVGSFDDTDHTQTTRRLGHFSPNPWGGAMYPLAPRVSDSLRTGKLHSFLASLAHATPEANPPPSWGTHSGMVGTVGTPRPVAI